MFKLTEKEYKELTFLRFQNGTLKNENIPKGSGKHRKYLPYVFTEQGVTMLSAVLKSDVAIEVSIQIIKVFVEMRKFITNNAGMFQRLENVEQKQIISDKNFKKIFKALDDKSIKPKQGIFYNGQVFDAYRFVTRIIKSAKKSIILIDNYVDEETLYLLSSRRKKVSCNIYTAKFTKKLQLDLKKFNEQNEPIQIDKFSKSHDRFLIIDEKVLYHFGASLKDLGKKWFGFSKMDMGVVNIMDKLNS